MRKILLSLSAIIAVTAIAVKSSQALFSDTETSNDNTFATGTLNLTVNDHEGIAVEHVNLTSLLPGWQGFDGNGVPNSGIKWQLKNVGSLPGDVTVEFADVHNHDNTCLTPETVAGDTTCGSDEGELGDYLEMATWKSPLGGYTGAWASGFHNFNQYSTQAWNLDGTVTLGAGESIYVGLKLRLPSTVDNIVQSDSLSFDVVFHLDQTP